MGKRPVGALWSAVVLSTLMAGHSARAADLCETLQPLAAQLFGAGSKFAREQRPDYCMLYTPDRKGSVYAASSATTRSAAGQLRDLMKVRQDGKLDPGFAIREEKGIGEFAFSMTSTSHFTLQAAGPARLVNVGVQREPALREGDTAKGLELGRALVSVR